MKIRRKPFKNLYQQEYFVYITLIISIYQSLGLRKSRLMTIYKKAAIIPKDSHPAHPLRSHYRLGQV